MKLCTIILLCSCHNSSTLHPPCGLPCWPDAPERRNVGVCKDGQWECNEAGRLTECIDAVVASREICNNRDDDCNGRIDDGLALRGPKAAIDAGCYGLGVCAKIEAAACHKGVWECELPKAYETIETRCDGLDNDCDGYIDNIDFGNQYCYSGPVGTEFHPPCHPGTLACYDGEITCVNQMTPQEEVCDGLDNDCDGATDNTGITDDQVFDIVIGVDKSGSMQSYIQAVVLATSSYIQQFPPPVYRFAIVDITGHDPRVFVDTQFTDFQTVHERLQTFIADGSQAEGNVDGIYYVCDRDENPLGLEWRTEAIGVLLLFSDEPAQNYTDPQVAASDIPGICSSNRVTPFVWSRHTDELKMIVANAGGQHFYLEADAGLIEQQLNAVEMQLCQTP